MNSERLCLKEKGVSLMLIFIMEIHSSDNLLFDNVSLLSIRIPEHPTWLLTDSPWRSALHPTRSHTWSRLGPGTVFQGACNLHLDNKTQETIRDKITTRLLQREQLWAITYKKATNQLPLWRCREQKQGTARDPCMQHRQGGGQTSEATPPAPPTLPSP